MPNPFALGSSAFGVDYFGAAPVASNTGASVSTISHTTWLLDWETGDLCLDAAGNIAVASAPYSVSQDIATQLSTFLGECWYDSTQGVPYWQQILGQRPPASYIAAVLEAQALEVPDVATATVTIGGLNNKRGAIGQLLAVDTDGSPTVLAL